MVAAEASLSGLVVIVHGDQHGRCTLMAAIARWWRANRSRNHRRSSTIFYKIEPKMVPTWVEAGFVPETPGRCRGGDNRVSTLQR